MFIKLDLISVSFVSVLGQVQHSLCLDAPFICFFLLQLLLFLFVKHREIHLVIEYGVFVLLHDFTFVFELLLFREIFNFISNRLIQLFLRDFIVFNDQEVARLISVVAQAHVKVCSLIRIFVNRFVEIPTINERHYLFFGPHCFWFVINLDFRSNYQLLFFVDKGEFLNFFLLLSLW